MRFSSQLTNTIFPKDMLPMKSGFLMGSEKVPSFKSRIVKIFIRVVMRAQNDELLISLSSPCLLRATTATEVLVAMLL